MKSVKTNNIVANVRRQRFPKSSLDHLQESVFELGRSLLRSLHIDESRVTILKDCDISQSENTFNLSAGWAAHGGEIFEVLPSTITTHGFETAVWQIQTNYRTTDPVRFSDGTENNVNEIRRLTIVAGVSGSGLSNWNDTYEPLPLENYRAIQGALTQIGSINSSISTINSNISGNDTDITNLSQSLANLDRTVAEHTTMLRSHDSSIRSNATGLAGNGSAINNNTSVLSTHGRRISNLETIARWTPISLQQGWRKHTGALSYFNNGVPGYRIDRNALYFIGVVQSVARQGSNVLFSLPVGYRPARNVTKTIVDFSGNHHIIQVLSNGQVIDWNRDAQQAYQFSLMDISGIPLS